MRIAMIGHKRIPSREGGVEIVVEELAVRMTALGHSVTVYNRGGEHVAGKRYGPRSKEREYRGVRMITVPTPKNRMMNAMVYSLLATLHAVFRRYDILHYHAEGPGAMLFIPRILRKKTVSTVHGLDWQRGKWGGFAVKYLLFGERMIAGCAGAVIVLSENVQNYFRDKYGRETRYVPNAVNAPDTREPREGISVIKEKYGLDKDGYLLFLARLVPEKGLHYLLEAFRRVDTDLKLVVAGGVSHSDEYAERIKKMAKEDSRVILTGFVQGRELSELYGNCRLYVLPSDIEGMPLTLLEAMSYGRRCLVSDIPENTAVGGDFVRSFKKSDVGDLEQKLRDILSDVQDAPERPDTPGGTDGLAARDEEPADRRRFPSADEISAYILGKYNWDDVVRRTLDIYRGLL